MNRLPKLSDQLRVMVGVTEEEIQQAVSKALQTCLPAIEDQLVHDVAYILLQAHPSVVALREEEAKNGRGLKQITSRAQRNPCDPRPFPNDDPRPHP